MKSLDLRQEERYRRDLLDFIGVRTNLTKDSNGNYFTPNVKQAQNYLIGRYGNLFDEAYTLNDVVILHKHSNRKENRPLIINGHFDVAEVGSDWKKDVWGQFIDDKIYGRGATDMKGQICSALSAFEIINENKVNLNNDVYFILTPDEESTSNSIKELMDSPFMKSLSNAYAIVPEANDLVAGICQRGLYFCELKTNGGKLDNGSYTAIHDSALAKEKIPNAILENMHLFGEIREYVTNLNSSNLANENTINLGYMVGQTSGRDQPNSIPNQCLSRFTIRYLPKISQEKIESDLENIVFNYNQKSGLGASLVFYEKYGGFETSPDSKLVSAVGTAMKRADLVPKFGEYNAYSNGDFLAKAGMEVIVWGGSSLNRGKAHGTDEFIERKDFNNGIVSFYNLFEEGII